MRILFVMPRLGWPRSSGADVHCYYMMRSLAELGHEIGLATVSQPAAAAVAGLTLGFRGLLTTGPGDADEGGALLNRLQRRLCSYLGADPALIPAVARAASAFKADTVVATSPDMLPRLAGVRSATRVWYAADSWALSHLTLIHLSRPGTWGRFPEAAIAGLIERSFASSVDRIWVVSRVDGWAMRRVTGIAEVDVIPNGIDVAHYAPLDHEQIPRSCAFWGRLDFAVNIQAIEWFLERVWPALRREVPDALFSIYGFSPAERVRGLARTDGVRLVADLPDLRGEIARNQVVVLPLVSGAGVKNKFLEAASMGKAILCTPRACNGLRLGDRLPVVVSRRPADWVRELASLWNEPERREALGREARNRVVAGHAWRSAAEFASDSIALNNATPRRARVARTDLVDEACPRP